MSCARDLTNTLGSELYRSASGLQPLPTRPSIGHGNNPMPGTTRGPVAGLSYEGIWPILSWPPLAIGQDDRLLRGEALRSTVSARAPPTCRLLVSTHLTIAPQPGSIRLSASPPALL